MDDLDKLAINQLFGITVFNPKVIVTADTHDFRDIGNPERKVYPEGDWRKERGDEG